MLKSNKYDQTTVEKEKNRGKTFKSNKYNQPTVEKEKNRRKTTFKKIKDVFKSLKTPIL